MERALRTSVVLASVLVAAVAASTASARAAEARATLCRATPVRTIAGVSLVRVGSLVGHLDGSFDIVEGRFALHVGRWRVPGKLTQKIPWFITASADSQPPVLVVTGVRTFPRRDRFRQVFDSAAGVYPSIIAPPSAGCWRLTFSAGDLGGTLTALVRK
jgi:hypothetical protein